MSEELTGNVRVQTARFFQTLMQTLTLISRGDVASWEACISQASQILLLEYTGVET